MLHSENNIAKYFLWDASKSYREHIFDKYCSYDTIEVAQQTIV